MSRGAVLKVFVYEWVCGGGFQGRDDSAPESLLSEGWAMLSAVVHDFAAADNALVTTLAEPAFVDRLQNIAACRCAKDANERDRLFDLLVDQADATVLIAPEFDGVLLGLAERVVRCGGRLLSPDPDFIQIASDKQSTIERLHAAGVRTPRGVVVMAGEYCPASFSYPAVLKPIDGCGSVGVERFDSSVIASSDCGAYRLEELVHGMPVSVALLCDSERRETLQPCLQLLGEEGDYAYQGGETPIESSLAARASSMAVAAVAALPATTGYVGVDLVLGEAEDGSQDYVIEINPRYTTSYVGLRAATDANLAQWVLSAADGEPTVSVEFHRSLSWNAAGEVRIQ